MTDLRIYRSGGTIGVAALAICLLASRTLLAAPPDPRTEAKADLVKGMALMDQGDYQEALKVFEAAFALVPSPKIYFNMGLALQAMNQNVKALENFDRFLKEATDIPQNKRDQAEEFRRQLSARVETVTINTDAAGIELTLDGKSLGLSPLKAPAYVEPGPHQIVANQVGRPPVTKEFVAVAGGSRTVGIAFAAPVTSPPHQVNAAPAISVGRPLGPASSSVRPTDPRMQPSTAVQSSTPAVTTSSTITKVVFWTAVASVAVSAGLALKFNSDVGQYNRNLDPFRRYDCGSQSPTGLCNKDGGPANPLTQAQKGFVANEIDNGSRAQTLRWVFVGLGSTFAVVAGVLLVYSRHSGKREPAQVPTADRNRGFKILPMANASGGGFSATFEF